MRVLVAAFLIMGLYGLLTTSSTGATVLSFVMAVFVAVAARRFDREDSNPKNPA
jgi:heme exporter protein D